MKIRYIDSQSFLICLLTLVTFTLFPLPVSADGEIEAVMDYIEVIEGNSIVFNVLENDIGGGLEVILNTIPEVGSLALGEEEGEFIFDSEGLTPYYYTYFEYEIQDSCGQKDMIEVFIYIEPLYRDLMVQTERDCTNAESKLIYTLTSFIDFGRPPYYYIVNWGHEEVLQEPGVTASIEILDGFPYRALVVDSSFNVFTEYGGEIACLKLNNCWSKEWGGDGNYAICRYPINEEEEVFFWYHTVEDEFENNPYSSYDAINVSAYWIHPQDFTEHLFDLKDSLHLFIVHEGEYCPYFETEYVNEDNGGIWAHIADTIPIGAHVSIDVEIEQGSYLWEYCTINDFSYYYLYQPNPVTAQNDTLAILNQQATKLYPLANDEGHYLTIAMIQYANLDTVYQLNDSTLQVVPSMETDIEEAVIRYLTVNKANLEYDTARIVLKAIETSEIEAVTDSISYQTAQEGFNRGILYNDIGEDLTLIDVEETTIGELSFSSYGWIYYQANDEVEDTTLQLEYVIEDAFGQRDTGLVVLEVKVSILELNVERNCCAFWTDFGTVQLEATVSGGVPPYHITGYLGSENIDTLIYPPNDSGIASIDVIPDYEYSNHEIFVEDATGNCSYDQVDDFPCGKLGHRFGFLIEAMCIGEDNMQVDIGGEYECFIPFEVEVNNDELDAYWIDLNTYGEDTEERSFNNGGVISSRAYISLYTEASYLTYEEERVYGSLYGRDEEYVGCNDTLIARNDTLYIEMNTELHFSVLANDDFNVGVRMDKVENPSNGELLGLGMAKYSPTMSFSGMDSLQYQIIDSEGNRDTAMVFIEIKEPDTFTVNWRRRCIYLESEYLLQIGVAAGELPYHYVDSWGRDTLIHLEEGVQNFDLEWRIQDGCGFGFAVTDATGNFYEENQVDEKFCGTHCSSDSQTWCDNTSGDFVDFEVAYQCLSADEMEVNYELVYDCFLPYEVAVNEEEFYAYWVDLNKYHNFPQGVSFENGDILAARSYLYLCSKETNLLQGETIVATDTYENWSRYLGCSDTLIAVNDTLQIVFDDFFDYRRFSALANDEFGQVSEVEVLSEPNNGTLSNIGHGSYTPNLDFIEKDSIQYRITDGEGQTSTAWVLIDVAVPTEFTVKWERNCVSNEDYYLLQMAIAGGSPPYQVFDNWGRDTLLYLEEGREVAILKRKIEKGCSIRFTVRDAVGAFYKSENSWNLCGTGCDSEDLIISHLKTSSAYSCATTEGSLPQLQVYIQDGFPPYHYTDTWGNDTIIEAEGIGSLMLQFEIPNALDFHYTVSDEFGDTLNEVGNCLYTCFNEEGIPFDVLGGMVCMNDSIQWNFEVEEVIEALGGEVDRTWANSSDIDSWTNPNELQSGQWIPNRSYLHLLASGAPECGSPLLSYYTGYVGCSEELQAINDTLYISQNESIASNVILGDEFDFVNQAKRLSNPSKGILSQWSNAGYFTYKPSKDFVGIDSFRYEIKNLEGEWSAATVYIFVETAVGIEGNTSMNDLQVHPNPFNDKLYLQIPFASSSPLQITLFNTLGQKVYEKKAESSFEVLDLKELKSGVYFVQIEGEMRKWRRKMMKF